LPRTFWLAPLANDGTPSMEFADVSAPHSHRALALAGVTFANAAEAPFWKAFGDPVLNGLVEQALTQNLDLRAAWARLEAARALRAGG
jgi:multidrug efflux system outer membrane protein